MNKLSRLLLILASGLILLSIFLFIYKQKIFAPTAIDAERFSQFGTFISAILSLFAIVFIYFTFRQTQQTQQLSAKTLTETQKNSLDNTFFNLVKSHQNIVSHLHNRITLSLKMQYIDYCAKVDNHNPSHDHKDFFELMYGILDAFYKGNHITDEKHSKIKEYFKNQDWVMGHSFRSLEYSIDWVENNCKIDVINTKEFYIGFLQSQLSSDELRLFFYYILSKEDPQRKRISQILNRYKFFDSIKDQLIFPSPDGDWDFFKTIAI